LKTAPDGGSHKSRIKTALIFLGKVGMKPTVANAWICNCSWMMSGPLTIITLTEKHADLTQNPIAASKIGI